MRPRTWSPKRNKKIKNDTASGGLIQGENFTGPGAKEPKIKKRKVKQIENTTWDLKPKSKETEKRLRTQRRIWGPESLEKEKELDNDT